MQRYEIRVRGRLGDTMLRAFPELQATIASGDTVLSGRFEDSAALHSAIAQVESLGLELIEVRRLPCQS